MLSIGEKYSKPSKVLVWRHQRAPIPLETFPGLIGWWYYSTMLETNKSEGKSPWWHLWVQPHQNQSHTCRLALSVSPNPCPWPTDPDYTPSPALLAGSGERSIVKQAGQSIVWNLHQSWLPPIASSHTHPEFHKSSSWSAGQLGSILSDFHWKVNWAGDPNTPVSNLIPYFIKKKKNRKKKKIR